MRAILLILVLLCATPAPAAPTCQTKDGGTIRCGTPGAMPVGWQAPPEQWHPAPSGGSAGELPQVLIVLLLLFVLIALMPEFDGRRAGDWDRQEDDDTRE